MKPLKTKKALALRYNTDLPAPVISAKGSGHMADRIVTLAEASKVPVVNDDNAAALLSPLDIGDFVPEEYWEIVAKILVLIRNVGT